MGRRLPLVVGVAVSLALGLAGCGATTHTVTVTVTSASTASAESQSAPARTQSAARKPPRSSPCQPGECDPYGPQGGCFAKAHPDRTTNPLSCPAGKQPTDGGCAPPSEISGSPTSSTQASSATSGDRLRAPGTGGGVMFSLRHGGGTACEYSLDFSRWCGSAARDYQTGSPRARFSSRRGTRATGWRSCAGESGPRHLS